MKKLALVLLLVFAVTMIISAEDSSLYVRTLYIEKIYPSSYGYKIEYRRTNSLFFAEAYIPLDWFGGPDSKARMIYATDNAVPFMNVYWERDGEDAPLEFSHLVLCVHPSMYHISWGSLPENENVQSNFDLDEPHLAY